MKEVDLEFNEKIRKGREEKGLSQAELAKNLNERASLIKKLERGEVLPTEKVRKKLEKHLKILSAESDLSLNGYRRIRYSCIEVPQETPFYEFYYLPIIAS